MATTQLTEVLTHRMSSTQLEVTVKLYGQEEEEDQEKIMIILTNVADGNKLKTRQVMNIPSMSSCD
jgi:hypothetical protein